MLMTEFENYSLPPIVLGSHGWADNIVICYNQIFKLHQAFIQYFEQTESL